MAADKPAPKSPDGEQPEKADLVAIEAEQAAREATESLRAMVGKDSLPTPASTTDGLGQFVKEQLAIIQDSRIFKNTDNAEQSALQDKAKQGKATPEEVAKLAALRTFPDNPRGQELVIKEYLDNQQSS